MYTTTDQLGNTLNFNSVPKRVVSIVPSQSEFLWDIGLREELVGITKFCIHPHEMFRTVERVGGTKKLDLEKIRQLKPDIIIGNKEENEREQINILQKEFPVWMSDIFHFDDALAMMTTLGDLLGKRGEALKIVGTIKTSLSAIRNLFSEKSVAYFIWNKPYMLAAADTYIDAVLKHIGFDNAAKQLRRYPEVTEEELRKLAPELCFLSSEPFPFKEQHVTELKTILPKSKVVIVDGEMFSWYGSRLMHLEPYLLKLKGELSRF